MLNRLAPAALLTAALAATMGLTAPAAAKEGGEGEEELDEITQMASGPPAKRTR